jgi:quercetin dioxygenase-like cupin family protein
MLRVFPVPPWVPALLLAVAGAQSASAQPQPVCVDDSPERRGGIGCSIIETKSLPESLKEPLFWHVDQFESSERARAAVGPASVSFEAHGTWWLVTIESEVSDHHGARHVTQLELPLPCAPKYSMQVISAAFIPGMASLVHVHSGAEAWYVVTGEQCLETPARSYKTHKGETLVVPAGTTMRLVATGSTVRRAIAIIVYDASQPATTRLEKGPQLVPCE